MHFQISTNGLEITFRTLQHIQNQAKDIRPLLVLIGQGEVERTNLRFIESKDPEGQPWKPLKQPVRRRNRRKGGEKPLRDTDRLMESIDFAIQDKRLTVGVTIAEQARYGKYHQFGWGVPRRAFLGWTQELADEIEDYTIAHLTPSP